jgi:ATP-dependent DNA ligase
MYFLKPQAAARIDFLEWTWSDRLRHTKFVSLRDDKDPRNVFKEDNYQPVGLRSE